MHTYMLTLHDDLLYSRSAPQFTSYHYLHCNFQSADKGLVRKPYFILRAPGEGIEYPQPSSARHDSAGCAITIHCPLFTVHTINTALYCEERVRIWLAGWLVGWWKLGW